MKTFFSWAPPISISLMLHIVLLLVATNQFSNNKLVPIQAQAISVELLGKTSRIASKPRVNKTNPVLVSKPTQEPVKVEQTVVQNVAPEDPKSPTIINGKTIDSATESKQSSPIVYPISKLTRQPSFLLQVEPGYPNIEKRAGRQAKVLAEVTIDSKGNVLEVKFPKSAGVYFDTAVREALMSSIFVPGYIDKEAVAVRVLVPYTFNLK